MLEIIEEMFGTIFALYRGAARIGVIPPLR